MPTPKPPPIPAPTCAILTPRSCSAIWQPMRTSLGADALTAASFCFTAVFSFFCSSYSTCTHDGGGEKKVRQTAGDVGRGTGGYRQGYRLVQFRNTMQLRQAVPGTQGRPSSSAGRTLCTCAAMHLAGRREAGGRAGRGACEVLLRRRPPCSTPPCAPPAGLPWRPPSQHPGPLPAPACAAAAGCNGENVLLAILRFYNLRGAVGVQGMLYTVVSKQCVHNIELESWSNQGRKVLQAAPPMQEWHQIHRTASSLT